MKPFTKFKLLIVAGTVAATAPLFAFLTFSGNPKWSTNSYVADLNTVSFPAGSVWDSNAQWSMSDWRDSDGTSLRTFYTRTNSDFTDHGNGRNSWVWQNRPSDSWLGVTFVRWIGSSLTDCDIWYNSRSDYSWTTGLFGPCAYRSYWPIDFRNVARHETGHAIGLDHEDDTLAQLNRISTHGSGVQHSQTTGMMPHADDKRGLRFLYPQSETVRNMMATNWREPSTGGARQEGEETGTWPANSTRTIEFWLENQSTVTIPGFSSGVRTGIYLSTNSTISDSDTRIYETTYAGHWNPGVAGRYTPTARVPDVMPAGQYYVGVFFDNRSQFTEQWESDNTCVLGRVTVSNSLRSLNIRSVNPSSGVTIGVSLADSAGRTDGATPFSRTYWGNTQRVTLTAPASVGNNDFRFWRLNGVDQAAGDRTLAVLMNGTETAEAVFWNNIAGSVRRFGRPGCRGTNGSIPVHNITWTTGRQGPQQGSRLSYLLSSARGSTLAAAVLGLHTDFWGRLRLPLNLVIIGMDNGCWLNHDIIVELPALTTAAGTHSELVIFPVEPSSVGAHVYSSYVVLDPGANTLGAVMSGSLDLLIGGNRP